MKRGKIVHFHLKLLLGTLCVVLLFSFSRPLAHICLRVLFAVFPFENIVKKTQTTSRKLTELRNGKVFFLFFEILY